MIILLILVLLISITFHEYAHGWMAYKLGDPTPAASGRLTLNPLAHIDPFGTIILPILLLVISKGALSFGYAKPVPINPYHFKNPRKDIMWVGIAGPLANFLIAFILSLMLKMGIPAFFEDVIIWGIIINLILGIFNLIPIPPLDGSKIIASFLPYRLSCGYLKLQIYGFIFIILLINLGFFNLFIIPAIKVIFSLWGIGGYCPF